MEPRARTTREMQFAASLEPCPYCKTREPARFALVAAGDAWKVEGACPRCRQIRAYTWPTEGDPNRGAVAWLQLGDARPSQIIRPGQFLAELDRQLLLVRPDPEALPPAEWNASAAARDRAMTCLHELLKFVPPGADALPDSVLADDERADRRARPERYRRDWLHGELDRLTQLAARHAADAARIQALDRPPLAPASGEVTPEALIAHHAWLRGAGAGRLVVVDYDASARHFEGALFQAARLERVRFDGARLEGARMMQCALDDISARDVDATSIQLVGATLIGGSFERAVLVLASFDDAVIDATTFAGANLDCSQWRGAEVTMACFDDATFGDARFDGGRFRGCTFRRADFRAHGVATTANARFADCDLRGTRWDGRDLTGATFVRCKLYGIQGTPSALADITIEDPDLSPDGDGSDIGDADDVLAMWR